MSLSGVLVKQLTIKSDADKFYELFRYNPHHISEISPHCIQGVYLLDGEWGVVGSIVVWNFTNEGKAQAHKNLVEAIDENKRLVCFKVLEGSILEEFKSFSFTVDVDTKGEENLVTWTIHYEKLNDSVNDPESLMNFILGYCKEIDNYHLFTY